MSYIENCGLEVEGYAATCEGVPVNTKSAGLRMPNMGEISSDAGVGLIEVITKPRESIELAIRDFQTLSRLLRPNMVYFQAFRPEFVDGHGQWVQDPRYDALRDALVRERGEAGKEVNHMTDMAAVHINIDGQFNPVGEDGLFLFNMINLAGPHMAAYVHEQLGDGVGHLARWQHFADPRRLPRWEWRSGPQEFKRYFESIPRLFRMGDDRQYVVLPKGECQQIGNSLDHGVFWKFLRPKPLQGGKRWYSEVRLLPSMDAKQLSVHGPQLIQVIETLLDWFNRNGGHNVHRMEDAASAFEFVHERCGPIFPEAVPSETAWYERLVA